MTNRSAVPIRLGLKQIAAQFTLLVAVNAMVGGLLGSERAVLPLLATYTFHLTCTGTPDNNSAVA